MDNKVDSYVLGNRIVNPVTAIVMASDKLKCNLNCSCGQPDCGICNGSVEDDNG